MGKLYILFNINLLFSIKNLKLIKEEVSLLKILLFISKDLKSVKNINIIIIKNIKDKKIIKFRFILKKKVSLEAREVIYINRISIPPIKIKNKE